MRPARHRPAALGHLDHLLQSKDIVQTEDALAEPIRGPASKYGEARSLLAVRMFKENELVGAIIIYRQHVLDSPHLSDAQKAAILGGTAATLLGISAA